MRCKDNVQERWMVASHCNKGFTSQARAVKIVSALAVCLRKILPTTASILGGHSNRLNYDCSLVHLSYTGNACFLLLIFHKLLTENKKSQHIHKLVSTWLMNHETWSKERIYVDCVHWGCFQQRADNVLIFSNCARPGALSAALSKILAMSKRPRVTITSFTLAQSTEATIWLTSSFDNFVSTVPAGRPILITLTFNLSRVHAPSVIANCSTRWKTSGKQIQYP